MSSGYLSMCLFFVFTMGCSALASDKCEQQRVFALYNNGSDLVRPHHVASMIANEYQDWYVLYCYELNSPSRFGKCKHRWNHPDNDKTVFRETVCYNIDGLRCDYFNATSKIIEGDCGRALEIKQNGASYVTFFSQDLKNYFWLFACYGTGVTGDCDLGYLDLTVKADRFTDDYLTDLNGLPLEFIVADLGNNFNMKFSDPDVQFKWRGPDCSL